MKSRHVGEAPVQSVSRKLRLSLHDHPPRLLPVAPWVLGIVGVCFHVEGQRAPGLLFGWHRLLRLHTGSARFRLLSAKRASRNLGPFQLCFWTLGARV